MPCRWDFCNEPNRKQKRSYPRIYGPFFLPKRSILLALDDPSHLPKRVYAVGVVAGKRTAYRRKAYGFRLESVRVAWAKSMACENRINNFLRPYFQHHNQDTASEPDMKKDHAYSQSQTAGGYRCEHSGIKTQLSIRSILFLFLKVVSVTSLSSLFPIS